VARVCPRRGLLGCVTACERVVPGLRAEWFVFQSFETMDPNSLTAAIFKDKGADELVLPTFHPVVLPAPLRIVTS
jgi:hypothetical protein